MKATWLAALLLPCYLAASPLYQWQEWFGWPLASPSLTNRVQVDGELLNAAWAGVRLHWPGEANTLYEVQVSTNLSGPWLAYAHVYLTNRFAPVMADFPVFDRRNAFIRIMR